MKVAASYYALLRYLIAAREGNSLHEAGAAIK